MRRSVLIVLLACGFAACPAHVELQGPRAGASLEDRTKVYEQLRPLSRHESILVTTHNGAVTSASQVPSYLQLNNGARVYYPEDLLPVLPADSVAARAAEESRAARHSANFFRGVGAAVGAVALVVGVAIFAGAPAVPDLSPGWGSAEFDQHWAASRAASQQRMLGGGVGIGGVGLGLLVGLVGGLLHGRTAADSARTAFETFETGLRDRLGLSTLDDVKAQPMPPQASLFPWLPAPGSR